jgi:hypothetical protein
MLFRKKRLDFCIKNGYRQNAGERLRFLSEAVILQAIEDLWNIKCREECTTFFNGEGFIICAEMAKISLLDQIRILNMVNRHIVQKIPDMKGMKK